MKDSWTPQRIIDHLARGRWFGGLPPDLQTELVGRAHVRRAGRGQLVYAEGDESVGLNAVLEGSIVLSKPSDDGEDVILHVGTEGFWFGEISVLTRGSTKVAVSARAATTILCIPQRDLDQMLEQEPRRYAHLSALLLERYAMALEYIQQIQTLDSLAHVAARLLHLSALIRLAAGPQAALDLPINQGELASMTGLSRPRVNLCLRQLADRGIVRPLRGRVTILDSVGLTAEARGRRHSR